MWPSCRQSGVGSDGNTKLRCSNDAKRCSSNTLAKTQAISDRLLLASERSRRTPDWWNISTCRRSQDCIPSFCTDYYTIKTQLPPAEAHVVVQVAILFAQLSLQVFTGLYTCPKCTLLSCSLRWPRRLVLSRRRMQDTACAPGGNFDLSPWALQLPTGSKGHIDIVGSKNLQS